MCKVQRLLMVACCAATVVALCQPSFAVVYSGGTGHTIAPSGSGGKPNDPGFANIGEMSIGSGIHLQDGWILTAYHVYQYQHGGSGTGKAQIQFESSQTTYYEIEGTFTRIKYNNTTNADLGVFRVAGDTGLGVLTIRSDTPSQNTDVTMIGAGRDRDASSILWYVDTDPTEWDWREEDFPEANGEFTGFKTSSNHTKRWGTNEVHSATNTILSGTFGTTSAFSTRFDSGAGDNECQVVGGDSGGGVFAYNSSSSEWELAGLMLALGLFNNQPAHTAVYDNLTYSGDLSLYRDQIIDALPEPATISLLVIGSLLVLVRRKRRLKI